MEQTTLLYVMAGAVAVSAVALMIQACLLFGMYKATQALQQRMLTLLPKLEELTVSSRAAVEEARQAIAEIRQKSNAILDSGQKQMRHLEAMLAQAAQLTNKQLANVEAILDDALGRVQETVHVLHKGVLKPVRGISGLVAGVSAAVRHLLSRRPNPDRVTLDEEMFI
jgi:ABC-type transporter Mla subunit MlaD